MQTQNTYSRKNVYDQEDVLLPIEQRTYQTKEGYTCIIIDGGNKRNYITVQIGDCVLQAQTAHVKSGNVKNPLHKSINNVGYHGVGNYSSKEHKEVYKLWRTVLRRVYDSKYLERQPTYREVTVCKEWHNFQNFAEWLYTESNYRPDWQLDKDLLSGTSKEYNKTTCIFIPRELNSFLANVKSSNTSGYTGVSWCKIRRKYRVIIHSVLEGRNKHLGVFDDILLADETYKKARKEQTCIWKTKMIGLLPSYAIDNIK